MPELLGEFLCGLVYGAIAFPLVMLLILTFVIALNSDAVSRRPALGWLWLVGFLLVLPAGIFLLAGQVMDYADRIGITLAVPNTFSRYGSSMTLGMMLGVLVGVCVGSTMVFRALALVASAISKLYRLVFPALHDRQGPTKLRQKRKLPS